MKSITSPLRPVLLTGFDLEIDCPKCQVRQTVADDPDGTASAVSPDEFVALHGFPGRYVLTYQLHCWTCGELFSGRLTIRSRSAPAVTQRRVWAG